MLKNTKLAVISDFHLDINGFTAQDLAVFRQVLLDLQVDHLHFAGDMSNDFDGLTRPFLTDLSKNFQVSFNLGNHDMVGLTEAEIAASDFSVTRFDRVAFVAFHGWYDYSFMPENSDFDKVLRFKKNFYFDRKIKREFDDVTTTNLILTRLEGLLTDLSKNPAIDRIVVSTHFVPERSFIIDTRYEKFARFNAYLGSQHFHELFMRFPKVSDVVFGHAHHRRKARQIEGVTYHSKPLGYVYEWQLVQDFLTAHPQFLTTENWRLRKRYQDIRHLPEWENYRHQHLAEEFKRALVIFDF